jgi:hypothetical protein
MTAMRRLQSRRRTSNNSIATQQHTKSTATPELPREQGTQQQTEKYNKKKRLAKASPTPPPTKDLTHLKRSANP